MFIFAVSNEHKNLRHLIAAERGGKAKARSGRTFSVHHSVDYQKGRANWARLTASARAYCFDADLLAVAADAVSKQTLPSARANSVSSLPRPTFSPGWMWVPR